jgi:adenylate cyclase
VSQNGLVGPLALGLDAKIAQCPVRYRALYRGDDQAFSGHRAAAIAHANRALRLSPFDLLVYTAHLSQGIAAIQDARYDEAGSHFAKSVQANSRFSSLYFLEAPALALAGRVEAARPLVRRRLELEPSFRLRLFSELLTPEIAHKFVGGVAVSRRRVIVMLYER